MKQKCLIVIGIVFFLISTVGVNGERNSIAGSRTLYVGGSGPGNYTTIQDAINASVDGDTVFVYQRSSPYQENIVIDKSISLIGENLNTIIETRNDNLSIIQIHHDSVKISNLHFPYLGGAYNIRADNSSFINISNCYMECSDVGVAFYHVENSTIFHNFFDNVVPSAIILSASNGNNVENNTFLIYSSSGIIICNNAGNNLIFNNNISRGVPSTFGIQIWSNAGKENKIYHNNLICSVWSDVHSQWFGNYYEHWVGHQYRVLALFPKIITAFNLIFPMINIDWHPARQPYEIPSLS